jgi:KDO2-lipid IV(A) lauroyltransferase
MRSRIITFILKLSAWLPLRINHLLGHGLGLLLMWSDNELKRVARINLEKCFPELATEQRELLLRRNMIETGKAFLESGHIWLANKASVFSLVKEVHGEEHLQRALEQGKGVILVAPHLGNWEMIGVYCSSHYPMTCLYRPPRLSGIDALIRHARERFGGKVVPTNAGGVRALYQALAQNELVGILPDQDPRDSGRFAPFFGIPASTITLLSRLVHKSHATALCAYAERLPRGRGFAIHFIPAPAELYEKEMDVSLAALNHMVEQAIRHIPAQYQWGYKRFLTRPAGEKSIYKRKP